MNRPLSRAAPIVEHLRRDRPLSPIQLGAVIACGVAAVVACAMLPDSGSARVGLAVVLSVLLGVICLRSPSQGVVATLVWLAGVGGLRRIVTSFQVDLDRDPLILVGVVGIGILFLEAVARGALARRRWLADGVLVLCVVALLWVVHPDQGGITVGLGGLIFWGAPMLWFWVGRGLVDRVLAHRVLWLAATIIFFVSVYALSQVLIAFPSWDWDYIFERGRFNSLYVGPGTYRPFATFASANELALAAGCGIVIFTLVAARGAVRRNRRELVVGVGGALTAGGALAFSSIRAPVLFVALAFAVLAVVRLRKRAIPLLVGGLVVVVLTGAVFSQIDPDSLAETGPQAMIRRAVVGLGHPFDQDRSTLGIHLDTLGRGLRNSFTDPLGDGTGSTNSASLRFDGSGGGTEWDISDGGVAFGIIGLFLVGFVSVAAFARVGKRAWRKPDLLNLATLGIMVVLLRHWWNGGHYFLAPLLWVLVGAADAPIRVARRLSARV